MPCAGCVQEMPPIARASGLQHRQMKMGRKRCQPLSEQALLKLLQRQEDAGMVGWDLLPWLSPGQEQLHWLAQSWSCPGPAICTLPLSPEKAKLCPICSGREIIQ